MALAVAAYLWTRPRGDENPSSSALISSSTIQADSSLSPDATLDRSSRDSGQATSITPSMVRRAELDATKQKAIWDLEHAVFELETFFGKPFATALAERQTEPLERFFRADFNGSILADATASTLRHAGITEHRMNRDNSSAKAADISAVLDDLLRSLSDVHAIDSCRLRALYIDRENDDATRWNSTWLLSAIGRNVEGAPVELKSQHRIDFVFGDDREIQHRPVVASWHVQEEIYRHGVSHLMLEVTESSGLAGLPLADNWELPTAKRTQYRFQIAVDDYNRDGYLDIAIATAEGRPFLLTGNAQVKFHDDSVSLGIRPWQNDIVSHLTFLTAWIDIDSDGFPDLVMGDRLYRNLAGKGFADVTELSGLKIGYEPMGCAVADYDLDGNLDLYILYQHSRIPTGAEITPWVGEEAGGAQNTLWRNLGDGRFRDVTAASGAGGGRRKSFAAAWLADPDDPYPNLYIANDFGKNVLLRNRGDGRFEDVTEESGTGDFSTSMGVAAGDLDNDGHPELYVANMYSKMGRRIIAHVQAGDYPSGIYEQILGSCAGNRLYRGVAPDHHSVEAGNALRVDEVGWAYAPAIVDLDGDGRLDLYASTGFMSFSRRKPDG